MPAEALWTEIDENIVPMDLFWNGQETMYKLSGTFTQKMIFNCGVPSRSLHLPPSRLTIPKRIISWMKWCMWMCWELTNLSFYTSGNTPSNGSGIQAWKFGFEIKFGILGQSASLLEPHVFIAHWPTGSVRRFVRRSHDHCVQNGGCRYEVSERAPPVFSLILRFFSHQWTDHHLIVQNLVFIHYHIDWSSKCSLIFFGNRSNRLVNIMDFLRSMI